MVQLPPPDASYTEPSKVLEWNYGTGKGQLGGEPMGVICAAGPFTVDTDLMYEPLGALLEQAIEAQPDVLLLVSLIALLFDYFRRADMSFAIRSSARSSTLPSL